MNVFYCHEIGHLIAACPTLKKKIGLDKRRVLVLYELLVRKSYEIDSVFEPFTGQGMISISGLEEDQVPITWLRDTGTAQSFILESALPFSRETYCGSDVLVQGIEMGVVKVPLHTLHIRSDLITGFVKVAVRTQLPVKGVIMIVGNDLAGGKVLPIPEVIENPLGAISASSKEDVEDLTVFPACVITRASHESFLMSLIFLTVSC